MFYRDKANFNFILFNIKRLILVKGPGIIPWLKQFI